MSSHSLSASFVCTDAPCLRQICRSSHQRDDRARTQGKHLLCKDEPRIHASPSSAFIRDRQHTMNTIKELLMHGCTWPTILHNSQTGYPACCILFTWHAQPNMLVRKKQSEIIARQLQERDKSVLKTIKHSIMLLCVHVTFSAKYAGHVQMVRKLSHDSCMEANIRSNDWTFHHVVSRARAVISK